MAVYEDIIGRLVGGRYRVREVLGAGSFGQVFKADQEVLGVCLRTVALKLFTRGFVNRENAATVFKEALLLEALSANRHSMGEKTNLVTVYDIGVLVDYDHIPYVAMEFVSGGSLDKLLRIHRQLPIPTIIRFMREICNGLALAHMASPQIIHRDLKPANILLGENQSLKVADFGVAIERSVSFLSGGGGGTLAYMPPEARAGVPDSPRTDIYALGLMMLEMLIGENPLCALWESLSNQDNKTGNKIDLAQSQLADMIDPRNGKAYSENVAEFKEYPSFYSILQRCLSFTPNKRFEHALTLNEALVQCMNHPQEEIDIPVETAKARFSRLFTNGKRKMLRGDYNGSLRDLQVAHSLYPQDPQVLFKLAEVCEQKEDWPAAILYLKNGLRLQSDLERMKQLALLYRRNGQESAAQSQECLIRIHQRS